MWKPDELNEKPSVIGWGRADMEHLPDEVDTRNQIAIIDGEAVSVPPDTALRTKPIENPFDPDWTGGSPEPADDPDAAATLEDLL